MNDFARAAFREREARQILRRRAWYVHATVYALTNALLVVTWALTGGGYPWFVFPLLGWGIGLAAHGTSAFLLTSPHDLVLQREQRRAETGDRP